MSSGFNVFRKLDNGEPVQVAWRPDRKHAEQLVRELNEHWPAEYRIEEALECKTTLDRARPTLR